MKDVKKEPVSDLEDWEEDHRDEEVPHIKLELDEKDPSIVLSDVSINYFVI